MTARHWSRPYYGVQHLAGLREGWQVTCIDYDTFAQCWIRPPGAGFRGTIEMFATIEEARQYGERRAHTLGAFAQAQAGAP